MITLVVALGLTFGFIEIAGRALRWLDVRESFRSARERLGLRPLPADRDDAATELWRQHQVLKTDPRFVLENLYVFTEGRLAAAEEAWMTPGVNRLAHFYRKFYKAFLGPSPVATIITTPRAKEHALFRIGEVKTQAIAALKNLESAETSEQRRYWENQTEKLIHRITELEPRFPPCQLPRSQDETTQSAHDRVNQVRELIGKTLERQDPKTIPDQLWAALSDWNDHNKEWTPQQLDSAATRIHNIAFR